MCGIAGILNATSSHLGVTEKLLNRIQHRGPDAWGVLEDMERGVCLGSRRLSILDLSENGKMPMFSEDKRVVVCQNGEIYNYPQLKKELEAAGYSFRSSSDTEVIIHGYEKWGEEVFSKLYGMFAIALFDKAHNCVILARDRIGIKPVYYCNFGETTYFSSEAKSFKEIAGYNPASDINMGNVAISLGFMFLPKTQETLLNQVKRIAPGTYVKFDTKKKTTETVKYWALSENTTQNTNSLDQNTELLDTLLSKVVKEHLASDVPLGVLLSGGLDSSLIAAYVKKHSNKETHTYTARFDHKFNESENAKEVANYLGTTHTELFIDTKDVMQNIEHYADTFDDLTTFDGGTISTTLLCKQLKKMGITVILLGEGSDEIFGGYSWFGVSKAPLNILPNFVQASLYYYAISRNISYNPSLYYKFWHKIYTNTASDDIFRKVTEVELTTQLPNHLLMKVDKSTMAASIEARVPFLDHRVVEFAYNLPAEQKLAGKFCNITSINEKYILRKVAEKHLQKHVAWRKKRGFMLPMRDVLQSDKNKVRDYLHGTDSLARKFFNSKELDNLLDLNGPAILDMQKEYLTWRLFLLEVWRKGLAK